VEDEGRFSLKRAGVVLNRRATPFYKLRSLTDTEGLDTETMASKACGLWLA